MTTTTRPTLRHLGSHAGASAVITDLDDIRPLMQQACRSMLRLVTPANDPVFLRGTARVVFDVTDATDLLNPTPDTVNLSVGFDAYMFDLVAERIAQFNDGDRIKAVYLVEGD